MDILLDRLKEGYNFSCIGCGRCCKGKDEGYVFLYGSEIVDIINALSIDLNDLFEDYLTIIEAEYTIFDLVVLKPTKNKIFLKSIVLKQNKNDGTCIFLNHDNKCKIYYARPYQCRTWPSWYYNMTRTSSFDDAMKKCPGFKLKNAKEGMFVSPDQIIRDIKKEIEIEQDFIKKMKQHKGDLRLVYPFLKNIRILDEEVYKK